MRQTPEQIVEAHQDRLSRRRAKYMADVEHFRARQRAWAHSPSGKTSLARKRLKDAERAKLKQAAYEAALQQAKETPPTSTPEEAREQLRQQAADCIQRLQGRSPAEQYFPSGMKGRTFLVVELV